MSGFALLSSGNISRPRLSDDLLGVDRQFPECILIAAPSGYGKSTLARQLQAEASVRGARTCLLDCSSLQYTDFWETLLRMLTGEAEAHQHDEAANQRAVQSHLDRSPQPVLIVLDNYHCVSSAELDRAVTYLRGPGRQVSVIVLAERTKLLDGPLLASRVRVVRRADLQFNNEEMLALAEARGVLLGDHLPWFVGMGHGWPILVDTVLGADSGLAPKLAIERFANDYLELMSAEEKKILLVASLIESISAEHAAKLVGSSTSAAVLHLRKLEDLGLLLASANHEFALFRCHPAVQPAYAEIADRVFDLETKAELLRVSAHEMRGRDPLSALQLFLAAGALEQAELVLVEHFTSITDREEQCAAALRSLDQHTLREYPTFAAARLQALHSDPSVSMEILLRLAGVMRSGALRRLESEVTLDPHLITVSHLQVMVAERMLGDVRASLLIAQQLESSILVSSRGIMEPATAEELQFSPILQPAMLTEMALTAMMCGDNDLTARIWKRLLSQLHPGEARGYGALDAVQGARTTHSTAWEIAALGGLALAVTYDGDFNTASQYLDKADALASAGGGITAPHLSWASGEIARAHRAYEHLDEQMLRQAVDRLYPWRDRLEQWPMVFMAELESTRYQRGLSWVLPQLRTFFAQLKAGQRDTGIWGAHLAIYGTFINTAIGNFNAAESLIKNFPADNSYAQIERARLLMYRGDDVQALLAAQRISLSEITQRQRVDRSMIVAVSAWSCGFVDEAFAALQAAGETIEECGLSMMLRNLPFEEMHALAVAAKEARVCDLTAQIERIPKFARCKRREALTEMEQRALESMVSHPALATAAEHLFIAPATLKRQRLAVYKKLGVGNRSEAILVATRMGLLELPDAG